MARIPRDVEPFFKWDPEGTNARHRAEARAHIDGKSTDTATRRATDRVRVKKWILRWAWALSTGVLVLGYAMMAILLTGHGDLIGL